MTQGTRPSNLLLIAGPLAVAGAIATWWFADRLVTIGPFDRAQVTLAVALPLLLVSPGLTALGAGVLKPSRSRRLLSLVPIALATIVVSMLVVSITQIGCRPVSRQEVILPALPVGMGVGAAYWIATIAGAQTLRNAGPIRAVLTAGVVAAIGASLCLALFFWTFGPVSCAAPG